MPAMPSCRALAVSALLLAGACVPLEPQDRGGDVEDGSSDDGGSTGSGDGEAYTGIADDGPFSLEWWVGETWETGGCVDLLVRLDSETSVSSWSLELELDENVDSWLYGGGGAAVVFEGGDDVAITPYSSALSAGQTLEASYCSEPLARPDDIDVDYEESEDGGGGEDGGSGSDEDTEGSVRAADGSVILYYDLFGTWGYEACMDLVLLNTSGDAWSNWTAEVAFEEAVDVVQADGFLTASLDEDSLTLIPEDGLGVNDGGSARGQICFEAASPPTYVRVDG